jgi:hypothetical protein
MPFRRFEICGKFSRLSVRDEPSDEKGCDILRLTDCLADAEVPLPPCEDPREDRAACSQAAANGAAAQNARVQRAATFLRKEPN